MQLEDIERLGAAHRQWGSYKYFVGRGVSRSLFLRMAKASGNEGRRKNEKARRLAAHVLADNSGQQKDQGLD